MASYPITDTLDHNRPIFTVSELSQALKRHIEDAFDFVRVRGEISGLKRAGSGHLYFCLKDTDAVLEAVCWRGAAGRLAVTPEDGMEMIATGRLTTYPGRSKYQIVVESLELAGQGALLKLLDDRRKKLTAEGLFDAARKKPIPFLPEVIGVITSPSGAVIRDILHRLSDRFPRRVLLWPVLVQGQGAAEQVVAAIEGFNGLAPDGPVPRPDVLIVARGGGSLENLWAFNEEIVVRAAAASAIPLISAVGHETDTTLIDFAADLRASTPTAAAEMAVPVRIELLAQVMDANTRLVGATNRMIAQIRLRLEGTARALPRPQQMVDDARQRLDEWGERLVHNVHVIVDRRWRQVAQLAARLPSPLHHIVHSQSRLAGEARALQASLLGLLRERELRLRHVAELLESYSYERVLERGFALVHDSAGRAITSVKELRPRMRLGLRFSDGEAPATVNGAGRSGFASREADSSDRLQGTLL